MTNDTFNCLASDTLSAFNITYRTHWMINADLQGAAPVLASIYAIFFTLAFFWNLFIVITYLVKYKLLKEPANLFLFNLALADLLVAVTVMIFSAVAQAGGEFVFGYTDVIRCNMCNLAGFCTMFCIFMSFHLLAALSIDRFILLTYPLRYKSLMSFWRAVIIIVVAWVISFIIGILPFLGFGQHEFNRQFGSCIPRFTGTNIKSDVANFYYIIFAGLEALIPIVIIGITNVFTYRLVSKFLKKNLKRKKIFRNAEELKTNSDEDKKYKHQQNQLVKVFGALCISNCVSWIPVVVVFAIGADALLVASNIPVSVYVFGWSFYLVNPVVHPIIESFFVKDLRYQVNRAKKTIRSASTAITNRLRFRDLDLDQANQAIDSSSTKTSKRTFNRDKAKAKLEISTMISRQRPTLDCSAILLYAPPSPVLKWPIKVGRITDNTSPLALSPEGEGVTLKSVLKQNSEPAVMRLEEVNEIFREENDELERIENGSISPIEISLPTSNGINNGIHIQDEVTETNQEDTHVDIEHVTRETHIEIEGDGDELVSHHSNRVETVV